LKVKAKYSDCSHLTEDSFKEIGFSPKTELHIKKDVEYEVYAMSLFEKNIYLQIINDAHIPEWIPNIFFNIINNEIPSDWICNFFLDDPKMVIGPNFIAKDIKSYNAMVEQEPNEATLFWQRVDKLKIRDLS